MILLFSSRNKASANIAHALASNHGFERRDDREWIRDGVRMIDTQVESILDVPTDSDEDLSIVLSTHRSAKEGRMLSAHIPGNWDSADMGGEARTLNIAHGPMLKAIAKGMKREADRIGWPFSLEADHHGPTPGKAIIFVEIGNGEREWEDQDAAEAVARALIEALDRVDGKTRGTGPSESGSEGEVGSGGSGGLVCALCFGGGHYSREFTRIELESQEIAVGHIAPKYAIDGLDEDTFRQGIERCVPRSSIVLIAKEGVNARQREKIIGLCEKDGIGYRLI